MSNESKSESKRGKYVRTHQKAKLRKYEFTKRKPERKPVQTFNLTALSEEAETYDEMKDAENGVKLEQLTKKVNGVLHVSEGVTGRRLLKAKNRDNE
jgi:hypothetical protein